jgi:hypothetical protein
VHTQGIHTQGIDTQGMAALGTLLLRNLAQYFACSLGRWIERLSGRLWALHRSQQLGLSQMEAVEEGWRPSWRWNSGFSADLSTQHCSAHRGQCICG